MRVIGPHDAAGTQMSCRLKWNDAAPYRATVGFDPLSPLCTSRERRPKPDVSNLVSDQARVSLPETGWTCIHATRPPNLATEFTDNGVTTPHPPAFTEGEAVLACYGRVRNSPSYKMDEFARCVTGIQDILNNLRKDAIFCTHLR